MIGNQRPGIAAGMGFGDNATEPINKIIPIGIIAKDFGPFYSPADDMVQRAGCVYACFARHTKPISHADWVVKQKINPVP